MKTFYSIFSLIFVISIGFAQKSQQDIPFYDYEDIVLTSEATITDYEQKSNKLQITGTVYESDGITPAKDVILYLYQHDENGEFQFVESNGSKRLRHRTWIKTDENGSYTFNTFVPGEAIVPLNYPRQYGPKQIYLVAKTESSEDFNLPAFMFEGDDLLSKSCKKRLKRKGIDCILNPELKQDILVAEKNITLPENPSIN
ncbi:MAG: hypothetical protein AAGH46_00495 [Bacteroidota bacterium]